MNNSGHLGFHAPLIFKKHLLMFSNIRCAENKTRVNLLLPTFVWVYRAGSGLYSTLANGPLFARIHPEAAKTTTVDVPNCEGEVCFLSVYIWQPPNVTAGDGKNAWPGRSVVDVVSRTTVITVTPG